MACGRYTLFEVGGRIYACSNGGKVVALDFPLCHFEVRMTAMSSQDSIGMDADQLEFRFTSASDNDGPVKVVGALEGVWAYAHSECSMVP